MTNHTNNTKNIFMLMGGTGIVQILTILVSPVLTRIYSPEVYGELGLILSFASVFASSVHLRLNLAIANAKNVEDAKNVLFSALTISFILSFICGCGLFLYWSILKTTKYTLFGSFIIFLVTVINSWIDIINYWQSYRGRYKENSRLNIIRGLGVSVSQIILGFFTTYGLMIGFIFGGILAIFKSIKNFFDSKDNLIESNFSKESFLKTLKLNKSFIFFSMPQGLLAAFSLNIVPILIGYFYNQSVVGFYWLAYRLLLAPIGLIGGGYRQVYHNYFSDVNIEEKVKIRIARKHTITYLLFFIPCAVVFYFWSEVLFSLIYGKSWAMAGTFASWLVICFGFDIAKVPTVNLIHAEKNHKMFLKYETLLTISRLGIVVITSILFKDSILTVKLFSIISSLFSLFLIFYILYFQRRKNECN